MNDAVMARITECPNMPTLPAVAVQILDLTARRDVELSDIAKVIENDPAMTTRVLKTVNSSFYGLTRRVGSIRQALAYLGMETVKGLVLGFSLARTFDDDEDVIFDFEEYWKRSIFAASAARAIASMVRLDDPEEAFVAALVRDIGMVALWRHFGDRYLQILDLSAGDHRRLPELERKYFEADHTDVGASMLEGWNFPSDIVDVVLLHHQGTSVTAQNEDLRRVVLLADHVVESLIGDPERSQAALRRYEEDATLWFDVRRGTVLAALRSITDHAWDLSSMFELPGDAKIDIESLLEEADRRRRTTPRVGNPVADPDPIDTVTGLQDRNAFQRDLLECFQDENPTSVLLVGVDGMRELNRDGGPGSGDAALGQASRAVMRTSRELGGDAVRGYRFVGAELAILVQGETVDRIGDLAERIRAAVRLAPLADENLGLKTLGVSIGVAIRGSGEGMQTPDEVLRSAMMALSEARRRGGGEISFHTPDSSSGLAA